MEKFQDFFNKLQFGTYQLRVSIIIILTSFVLPVIILLIPMMERRPDFGLKMANGTISIVDRDTFCQSTYYSQKFEDIYERIEIDFTNIDNWAANLKFVCHTREIFSLASTVYFIGCIASNYGLSKVPDLYGRRKIFIILNIITTLALFQLFFLVNFIQIIIACFTLGLSSLNMSIGSIYINEVLDKNYSGLIMGISNAMFPLAGLLNVAIIFFFSNWKIFFLFVCLLSLGCSILSVLYLRESAIWLKANGKNINYITTIKYIVKDNGNIQEQEQFDALTKSCFGVFKEEDNYELTEDKNDQSLETISEVLEENSFEFNREERKLNQINIIYENNHSYEIHDLFYYKSLRFISIISLLLWIFTGISFYGLLLNLENLTGNIFIDSLVSYSGELIAEIFSGYIANTYGKKVLLYSLVINSIGSLTFTLFDSFFLKIPLLFIASIGIASGFNVLYIFTPQYYPTNIKAVALSFFSLSNRIAAGCVPILLNFIPNLNFFIGIFSAILVLGVMFIPEVRGYFSGDDVFEKRLNRKHSIHIIKKKSLKSNFS